MPKSTSDAMREAISLIKRGKSPAQAAAAAGVKRQSIYASAVYQAWRKAQLAKVAQA